MWFCHNSWSQGTLWGVLLALPLCCSNIILSPRCLLRHMTSIPRVLHRLVSLSELSLWKFLIVFWCLLWCLLSAFRIPCGWLVHQWQLNHWGFRHQNPLEYTTGRHVSLLMMVCGPCQECSKWLFLLLLQEGGSFMLPIQLSSSHSIHMMGHTALGPRRVTQSIHLPYMVGMDLHLQVTFHRWHDWLWICGGHYTWWYWSGGWLSG